MLLLATTKNNFNLPVTLQSKLTQSELFKYLYLKMKMKMKAVEVDSESDYEPNEQNAVYIHLSKTVKQW